MKYISYLRVSTRMQGRSGLGLEAQRTSVLAFLNGRELIAEYVEVESGRRSTRPTLKTALAHANQIGATLVVAKLDRLTRNAGFLLGIIESKANVAFCDLPQIPEGPMGKFFLTLMAAIAELESGMTSDRTQKAMAAAKAQGRLMGDSARGDDSERARAVAAALALKPTLDSYRARGATSLRSLAGALNQDNVPAPGGGRWHPTTVARVLDRAA